VELLVLVTCCAKGDSTVADAGEGAAMKEFDPIAQLEEGGALLVPASELAEDQREALHQLTEEEVKQLIGIAATVRGIAGNHTLSDDRLNSCIIV
jgi:hypothetical protein